MHEPNKSQNRGGKMVMSGGCRTNNSGYLQATANYTLRVSEPLNATAWNCTFGGGTTQTITATIICGRIN